MDDVIDADFQRASSAAGFSKYVATVNVVGYFRLQEVAFKVDTHKNRTEITYLIVILHLVYGDTVQCKVDTRKREEVKPPLIPKFTGRSW